MFTSCIYKEEMMKGSWPEYHLVFAIGAMANFNKKKAHSTEKWQREALSVLMFVSLSPEKESLHCCQ